MPSDPLFSGMFSTERMRSAVSGEAWLRAMLEVEAALARAEARARIIPTAAAAAIEDACRGMRIEAAALAAPTAAAANPAGPLVEALAAALPPDAAAYVHWGATSQDIVDSAMILLARRGLEVILDDFVGAGDACAELAVEHRATLMAGRTLLQQAGPSTFGLKAAGWLAGVSGAIDRLAEVRAALPVQFGGATGTLAALGEDGLKVMTLLAEELDLAEPVVPWHTSRAPVAELAGALGIAAGSLGKIALDVLLLAQTEVGELSEGGAPGRSSAMPHKRNPTGAVSVRACVLRAQALVPVLMGGMAQEHERAAGAWQAEWESLCDLLQLVSAAAAGARRLLERVEVRPERMRGNLGLLGGLEISEAVFMKVAAKAGRTEARALVDAVVRSAAETGRPFPEVLRADPDVKRLLTAEEIDEALAPERFLGASDQLVDRALGDFARARAWRG